MAEVMASAQEAANNAVTSESQARAIFATKDDNCPTPTPPSTIGKAIGILYRMIAYNLVVHFVCTISTDDVLLVVYVCCKIFALEDIINPY